MAREQASGLAGARWPWRLWRPLSASALWRHAQAGTALAQVLALDPDIILMDEPFSALDVQTRQLMENEVLALWAAKKKAVLFITHDLDEAIAMSDRVVVLSAGPGHAPHWRIRHRPAKRPRDVAECGTSHALCELHNQIWAVLRDEVLERLCAAAEESGHEFHGPNACSNPPEHKLSRWWQLDAAAGHAGLVAWQLASRNQQLAFFLGEPLLVAGRVWSWFMPFGFGRQRLFPDGVPGNADIYLHLGTTLLETVLAFGIGTLLGPGLGLMAGAGTAWPARFWTPTSRPPTPCHA